jgi:hypothetical protein
MATDILFCLAMIGVAIACSVVEGQLIYNYYAPLARKGKVMIIISKYKTNIKMKIIFFLRHFKVPTAQRL